MTDYVWPIMVVSLRQSTERRAQISAQLHQAGLTFSFIDAIDGRNGLPQDWENKVDRPGTFAKHGYRMSDGEYACALSHQLVYRKIVNEGLPGAVVLEDDAILTPEFVEFYRKACYREADFIQLFCFTARIWRGPGQRSATDGIRLFRLAENAFMAVGYCLSRRTADYCVSTSLPIRSRADWPTDMTKMGAMLTIPSLIKHPPPSLEQSCIAPGRVNLIPEGFDFSTNYVKGWRRLVSARAWRRFCVRRLSRSINPGF